MAASGKPPTVGIDLGTTNSLAAFVEGSGRPACFTNFQGDVLTPSAILFQEDGVIVGREAVRLGPQSPEHFALAFKRSMGEPHFARQLGGKDWRPEVLSAMVLRRLRHDVDRVFPSADQAVITVPAYFDEGRRRATRHAGAIAGWNVVDIVNEPTAAAIAYAHDAGRYGKGTDRETVLVYDLGGGTFDATILEIRHGREYITLATEGEVRLGGHDWDDALKVQLGEQFASRTGLNPLATPRGDAEFQRLAQQVKHRLSQAEKASVPASVQGQRAILEVTRATFESLTRPLLERTRLAIEELLDQARLGWERIDRVLMVGGSTRMPMVRRMIEELTGHPPEDNLATDEAVAHGAAVYARYLGNPASARLVNVNSHDLRVIGVNREKRRMAATLIPRNSPLPAEKLKLIPVLQAGLREVAIPICEGESDDPAECELIGKVMVGGIPVDGRRWVVGVLLRIRPDGMVEVNATIRDPEKTDIIVGEVEATLAPQRGMTPEDIAAAREYLAGLEIR